MSSASTTLGSWSSFSSMASSTYKESLTVGQLTLSPCTAERRSRRSSVVANADPATMPRVAQTMCPTAESMLSSRAAWYDASERRRSAIG